MQWTNNKCYIFWVCVYILALVLSSAPYYIIICGLSGSTIFFHISYKRYGFRKKISNMKYVFRFPLQFFLSIFRSKKNWARCIINLPRSFVKSPFLLAGFSETCIFSTDSRKLSYQISWKSVQWDPSAMWTDGRTHGQTDRHTWRS